MVGLQNNGEESRRAKKALTEGEEHFRLMVQGLKDYAVCILDPQGRVISWNPGAQHIKGYREEEILGQHFSVFYTEDDVEQGHPEKELLVATREGRYEEEGVRVRKDGSKFWADVTITALKDEADDLRGFATVTRDITERRPMEEERARLAAIVESSDDAIIGKTLEGIITSWNNGAEKIYGYSAEEAVGRSISMLVPPERPNEIPRILESLRRGEKVDHFETVRLTKDGRRLDISLTVSPIKNSEGDIIGASTIARDITERKHAEEALRESEERFRATFEQAAVGVSHVALDGRWIRVNQKLCDILGYPRGELLSLTFQDITHPDDLDRDVGHFCTGCWKARRIPTRRRSAT